LAQEALAQLPFRTLVLLSRSWRIRTGIGNLHITRPTATFVNNNNSAVGFGLLNGPDLFNGPTNSLFASWNMLTSIGPVSGPSLLFQWTLTPVLTDAGVLSFSRSTTTGIFQATIVPEPGLPLFLLVAICGFVAPKASRIRSFL
jgi:hypothetical protein